MSEFDEYAEYAKPQLGDNLLAHIAQTAREAVELQARIERIQQELTQAQNELKLITESTLPELMETAGQKKLTTIDGIEIDVRDVVRASLPKARTLEAVKWLREAGHGGIVKNELKVDFGREEDKVANRAQKALEKLGLMPQRKLSVHTQTLGALVRELLADGKECPLELLGAHIQKTAMLTIK